MRRKRLSIDRAFDRHIVDARFAGNCIVFAIDFNDGGAVTSHGIVYFNLGVLVGTMGVKRDDGVRLTDLHVIPW